MSKQILNLYANLQKIYFISSFKARFEIIFLPQIKILSFEEHLSYKFQYKIQMMILPLFLGVTFRRKYQKITFYANFFQILLLSLRQNHNYE